MAGGDRGAGRHEGALPIPNCFPQTEEAQKFYYAFFATDAHGEAAGAGPLDAGASLDGKGQFSVFQNEPMGQEPVLGPARDGSGAQSEQIMQTAAE